MEKNRFFSVCALPETVVAGRNETSSEVKDYISLELFAQRLEEKVQIKLALIVRLEACLDKQIFTTKELNEFQTRFSRFIIQRNLILFRQECNLIAEKTKAWNDLNAIRALVKPLPTLEDVLWIMAIQGHKKDVAPLLNLSKVTRSCKILQPVMREVKNKDLYSQLHFFCMKGLTESVKRMLSMRSIDVESPDKRGWTCLMRSVQCGHTAICEMLLRKGARVDAINKDGLFSLNYATVNGNLAIFTHLANYGANLSSRNTIYGWTPLHRAVWYGHFSIVNEIVQRGVDISAADDHGETALIMARSKGRPDIVELLKRK